MAFSRRNFLKGAGGLAAAMALPSLGFSFKANAGSTSNPKKIVVLTLMGGNDGLNTAIPIDATQYALYQSMRANIHIPQASVLPFGFDASGVEFGLHPGMASLMAFQDKLALFPSTHTGAGANRSHFYQHDLIDAGLANGTSSMGDGRGWLGRFLEAKYPSQPTTLVAQDFAMGQLHFLRGNTFVLTLNHPENPDLGAPSDAISDAIWADIQYRRTSGLNDYTRHYKHSQDNFFNILSQLQANTNFNRLPDPGAMYPSTQLGREFKYAADMLLSQPSLEVVHIMQNGYDTHSSQGAVTGNQRNLLQDMADSLVAFYTDLGAWDPAVRDNLVVVMQSEFGRTVRENVGGGTDHGQGTCWMAFGSPVVGGVYGSYPGLEPENLDGGNWLTPTIDYRDVLYEILGPGHLGASTATAQASFPGYAGPGTPLNFIA